MHIHHAHAREKEGRVDTICRLRQKREECRDIATLTRRILSCAPIARTCTVHLHAHICNVCTCIYTFDTYVVILIAHVSVCLLSTLLILCTSHLTAKPRWSITFIISSDLSGNRNHAPRNRRLKSTQDLSPTGNRFRSICWSFAKKLGIHSQAHGADCLHETACILARVESTRCVLSALQCA